MSKNLLKAASFVGRFSRYQAVWLAVTALWLMVFISAYGAFTRRLLNSPIPFAIEASSFLLLALVVFGLAFVQVGKGHIGMSLVTDRLPARAREVFNLFSSFLLLAYAASLLWCGWQVTVYAFEAGTVSAEAKIPIWTVAVLLPVGLAGFCLQVMADLFTSVLRLSVKD